MLLKGIKINDFTNTDPARSLKDGHIGLQNHGNGNTVSFRDVRTSARPHQGTRPAHRRHRHPGGELVTGQRRPARLTPRRSRHDLTCGAPAGDTRFRAGRQGRDHPSPASARAAASSPRRTGRPENDIIDQVLVRSAGNAAEWAWTGHAGPRQGRAVRRR
ncbi:hypothetical protein [Nonomuraea sp. FMUSA5-5]|uniref:hypothetical protein n=1 Tax=Nonomuraea composti TaxID=2720023 RepID=UPI0019808A28